MLVIGAADYVSGQEVKGIFILSSQFCCEPKMALKKQGLTSNFKRFVYPKIFYIFKIRITEVTAVSFKFQYKFLSYRTSGIFFHEENKRSMDPFHQGAQIGILSEAYCTYH